MDTGGASSCQKDSWEAYIKWLSTAEFGDDDDESQSDSEEKDVSEGDAAPTRDQESPENQRVGKGAGAASDGDVGTVRKRKSRWEPLPDREGDRPFMQKKRSRWSPEKPSSVQSQFRDVKKLSLYMDPEFLDLKIKLVEINKKLRTGQVLDDKKPRRFRSPSPEPVYDNFGNRVNSRENRAREKLNQERQLILDRLANKGPSFKASFKRKLSTKVYIPRPQYPEYNPIGLVLGPQGLTQQRVESETGAKLYIRGKATGNSVSPYSKPAGDEKLHVRIEAENENSLNMAASMVRKLLFPVGAGQSELKLRELARPSSNSRANEMCHYCKQLGHYKNECPVKTSSKASRHLPTYPNGGITEQGNKVHGFQAYSNNALGSGVLGTEGGMSGSKLAAVQKPPQAGIDSALKEDNDETHVYIGNLPPSINDAGLVRLFLPFGQVTHAKVFRDRDSGLSMGYGSVRFLKAADALQAVSVMNGCRLDGKVLQLKSKVPLQLVANGSLLPSTFQQETQEEVVVSSALQAFVPHAGMPPSRAAQPSAPSSALQGMGLYGGPFATSSGREAHVGASGLLPPNHLVQQSQKQPSPSSVKQAGSSGSYLHYDYSRSQTQPFFSSATQGGVGEFYPPISYNYLPPLKQPVSSSATEAGASGFYHSSNVNIVESQKQPAPRSATEGGLNRNGSTLPPPSPFTLAANFFGQFMMAAAAAAAATSSSRSPPNPDQQQLHKHTGASNIFGGLPPHGPLQGRSREHYSEQGGTTYHAQRGSRGQ